VDKANKRVCGKHWGPKVPGQGRFMVLVEDAARVISYFNKYRPAKAFLVRTHLHD
jgi:hypothetical protein